MSFHELKSWVGLFEPIASGEKTHDLRVLDRDFAVGDTLILREWDPSARLYTGRICQAEITYITSAQHSPCAFSPVALHPAMGVLSIKLITGVAPEAPKLRLRLFGRWIVGGPKACSVNAKMGEGR